MLTCQVLIDAESCGAGAVAIVDSICCHEHVEPNCFICSDCLGWGQVGALNCTSCELGPEGEINPMELFNIREIKEDSNAETWTHYPLSGVSLAQEVAPRLPGGRQCDPFLPVFGAPGERDAVSSGDRLQRPGLAENPVPDC